MLTFNNYIVCLLTGIGLVTIIDTVGSIVSRKLNFSYGYFTLLSIFAYTYSAYLIAEKTSYWTITMFSVILIGIYDATVGWEISQKLRANYGQYKEYAVKLTVSQRVSAGIFLSIICGALGIYLADK